MKRIVIDRDDSVSMGLALKTATAVFRDETIATLCGDAEPGMQWDLTGEGSDVQVTLRYLEDGTLALALLKGKSDGE